MNQKQLFCSFVLIISSIISAADFEQYLQAHNAYAAGRYEEAAGLFAGLPYKSFSAFYNCAVASAKVGKIYEALKAAKYATRFSAGADHIRAQQIYRMLQNQLQIPQGKHVYIAHIQQYSRYIPTIFIQLCTFFLGLLLIMCVLYRVRLLFTLLLSFCMLVSMLLVCLRYSEENQWSILVKQMNAHVHSGPHDQYAVLYTAPLGMEFTVTKKENDWYCVHNDGCHGWISARDVDEMV